MQLDQLPLDALVVVLGHLPARGVAMCRLVCRRLRKAGDGAATTLYALERPEDAARMALVFPNMIHLKLGRRHDPNVGSRLVEALGAVMVKRPVTHRVLSLETGRAFITPRLGKLLTQNFGHLVSLKCQQFTGMEPTRYRSILEQLPHLRSLVIRDPVPSDDIEAILESAPQLERLGVTMRKAFNIWLASPSLMTPQTWISQYPHLRAADWIKWSIPSLEAAKKMGTHNLQKVCLENASDESLDLVASVFPHLNNLKIQVFNCSDHFDFPVTRLRRLRVVRFPRKASLLADKVENIRGSPMSLCRFIAKNKQLEYLALTFIDWELIAKDVQSLQCLRILKVPSLLPDELKLILESYPQLERLHFTPKFFSDSDPNTHLFPQYREIIMSHSSIVFRLKLESEKYPYVKIGQAVVGWYELYEKRLVSLE